MNRRKFKLEGMSFTVHFGRIGTVGQTKEKTFSSENAAKREHERFITEKTKNGQLMPPCPTQPAY
jgi:predicted DNA-binding WGR domain protein